MRLKMILFGACIGLVMFMTPSVSFAGMGDDGLQSDGERCHNKSKHGHTCKPKHHCVHSSNGYTCVPNDDTAITEKDASRVSQGTRNIRPSNAAAKPPKSITNGGANVNSQGSAPRVKKPPL